ncbi:MAG: glycosyl transferase family 2 [Gemmatimonadales bacterium]
MGETPGLRICVIIPVGPGDVAWRGLLAKLAPQFGADTEVLLAATTPTPQEFFAMRPPGLAPERWRWLVGSPGRATQQNQAAEAAGGRYLWFLHADSRVVADALAVLSERFSVDPDALWYFDLRFLPDGPRLMWMNEVGAHLRSHLLGMPFGDQGLALSRENFLRLGGFREELRYGEDHLFVWAARRAGLRLRPVGRALSTSARKYAQDGWLRTTLSHLWLTWRQAFPEGVAWLRHR